MSILVMPRLGETVTEGTVIRWLKREGEPIEKDEMIVEISTDKVDTEIPAPDSGIVNKIMVPEGGKVAVGTELALIDGQAVAAVAAPSASAVPEPEHPPDTGKFISPIVRRLAKEKNVDITQISGTGEGGRVTKKDVLGYQAEPAVQPAPVAAEQKPAGREEIVPLGHIRQAIAEHMMRSLRTSAHVTVIVEVDMEKVVNLRRAHKEEFERQNGYHLTYLPFVCRALVEALEEWPAFNAVLDGDNLILKHYVNLGIAVTIPDGLIVPVIKGAEGLNISGLAAAIHDLAERSRSEKLRPDEVHEGTFTITNPGSFGSIIQTPIINQPQVAILSLEAIVERPVVVDSAIAVRHMVNLGLSYDHRVNDGAGATQFLTGIKRRLESGDFGDELLSPVGG
ncbi:MAG: dihydrolipoamide acetyltransferase family protein [Actinomycetota bacterium]|nr:dihydrolipoamide acetyltransferase family protein [Actinomycetota bacterium]